MAEYARSVLKEFLDASSTVAEKATSSRVSKAEVFNYQEAIITMKREDFPPASYEVSNISEALELCNKKLQCERRRLDNGGTLRQALRADDTFTLKSSCSALQIGSAFAYIGRAPGTQDVTLHTLIVWLESSGESIIAGVIGYKFIVAESHNSLVADTGSTQVLKFFHRICTDARTELPLSLSSRLPQVPILCTSWLGPVDIFIGAATMGAILAVYSLSATDCTPELPNVASGNVSAVPTDRVTCSQVANLFREMREILDSNATKEAIGSLGLIIGAKLGTALNIWCHGMQTPNPNGESDAPNPNGESETPNPNDESEDDN